MLAMLTPPAQQTAPQQLLQPKARRPIPLAVRPLAAARKPATETRLAPWSRCPASLIACAAWRCRMCHVVLSTPQR